MNNSWVYEMESCTLCYCRVDLCCSFIKTISVLIKRLIVASVIFRKIWKKKRDKRRKEYKNQLAGYCNTFSYFQKLLELRSCKMFKYYFGSNQKSLSNISYKESLTISVKIWKRGKIWRFSKASVYLSEELSFCLKTINA